MTIDILSFRDDFFKGPTDAAVWRQVTRAFGVNHVRFIDNGTVVLNFDKIVIFDEVGEIPLSEFVHPEGMAYLFGCTAMNNLPAMYPLVKTTVKIVTPFSVPGGGMFGPNAAAIVLYDRFIKQ
jgi:hypothetical protein